MVVAVIPLATIIVLVFCLIVVTLFFRQRRRNQQLVRRPVLFPNTAFVPNPNVVPMRYPVPNPNIHPSQPVYPNPNQPFNPTPIPDRRPTPTPIILNPSSPPDPPPSDLMERMRQVQMLMMKIHRLENEPGEQDTALIQDLKQRVMELSNTDGNRNVPTDANLDSREPPPYVPREDEAGERPEHGDGSG